MLLLPCPSPWYQTVFFFFGQHYFTVSFSHENQKALELRTEDAKDCGSGGGHRSRQVHLSHPKVQAGDWADPGKTQTLGGEDMERQHMEGT